MAGVCSLFTAAACRVPLEARIRPSTRKVMVCLYFVRPDVATGMREREGVHACECVCVRWRDEVHSLCVTIRKTSFRFLSFRHRQWPTFAYITATSVLMAHKAWSKVPEKSGPLLRSSLAFCSLFFAFVRCSRSKGRGRGKGKSQRQREADTADKRQG